MARLLPDQVDAIHAALLASPIAANSPNVSRWPAALAAVAICLAAVVGWRVVEKVPRPARVSPSARVARPSPRLGQVPAPPVAVAARIELATLVPGRRTRYRVERPAPDEIIRLEDGTLLLDVPHLHPAERLRVVVGQTVIEDRGTRFDVTATAGRLISVRVLEGKVSVQSARGLPRMVGAGEVWRWGKIEPRSRPEAPTPGRPTGVATAPVPTPGSPPQPAGSDFQAGWAALTQGNFGLAAARFHAEAAHADSQFGSDAAFWEGVGWARAGQATNARAAFSAFVTRHGDDPRAGAVDAMLGWIQLQQGDREGARRSFEEAARDPSGDVRSSARAGLAALEGGAARSPAQIFPGPTRPGSQPSNPRVTP